MSKPLHFDGRDWPFADFMVLAALLNDTEPRLGTVEDHARVLNLALEQGYVEAVGDDDWRLTDQGRMLLGEIRTAMFVYRNHKFRDRVGGMTR